MARKRFVLMVENKEIAFEALHSPYVALSGPNSLERHPATEYFVAAWVNESDFYPAIISSFGCNRESAEATASEWNRLERDAWTPEDSS
jgi:hypothetical protein